MEKLDRELVVLGGGPGGYTAAFRAADLGKKVTIVESGPVLGGVCLNVGCIPSKTLLHLSEIIDETEVLAASGLSFAAPEIDLDKIKKHKQKVVKTLTSGLGQLAKARGVEIIRGRGMFSAPGELSVSGEQDVIIKYKDIIVAAGSRPVQIPGIPYDDPGIWDSTDALELNEIPGELVIIGGGIIGMEMASIYHGLGSKITVVEMADEIIPPADKDLKAPLMQKVKKQYNAVYTSARVKEVVRKKDKLELKLEGEKVPESIEADAVLVAVGRIPNSDSIGIDKINLSADKRGFISVNAAQKTEIDHVYAIGDITGNPMLAHRAVHQGKVAAEAVCGKAAAFTPIGIPSVAYTNPEIAWIGLTEREAAEKGIKYKKASFPWQASGRALSVMAEKGVSKALFDPETGRLLGAGITGRNAGELIGEAVLALEMGAVAADIGETIHPHPTLSETFALAAEIADGTITDILNQQDSN